MDTGYGCRTSYDYDRRVKENGVGYLMNTLQGKTVLVTGADGFIGRHLVNRLKQIQEITGIPLK